MYFSPINIGLNNNVIVMRELGSPCYFSGGFNPWLFRPLGWLLKLQLYDLN